MFHFLLSMELSQEIEESDTECANAIDKIQDVEAYLQTLILECSVPKKPLTFVLIILS